VSLSLASHDATLPAAYRLYLPEDWAADGKRRRETGVPKEIVFKTKPKIALEQIEACASARCGVDGRLVWLRHRPARQCQRTGADLCGRGPFTHHGVDVRQATAEKMVGPDESPLHTSFHQAIQRTCRSRSLPTQRRPQ